jgi:hypothetical protein
MSPLVTALMRVYRSPRTGRPVSAAGFPYAAAWTVIVGARAAFSSASWLFLAATATVPEPEAEPESEAVPVRTQASCLAASLSLARARRR